MKTFNLIKRKVKWVAFAICCSVAFISCKDDHDDNLNIRNQEFVTKAASSNNFEVAAGELAQVRGTSDAVKHYGQHMVSDHTVAGVELKALAATKGWMVQDRLQTKEQENLDRLNSLNGADFDREFAQLMVVSHQDAVSLFEEASTNNGVPDGDLRNWASGKLPKLRAHLQEANTLRSIVMP